MLSKHEQRENAFSPMDVTPAGMFIRSNPVQASNADVSIRLIAPRKFIIFRLEQKLKTSFSMHVTRSGMVADIKFEHPENAPLSIRVTPEGILTFVKPEHPENALFPMRVTPVGMLTVVKPEHPLKTPPSM